MTLGELESLIEQTKFIKSDIVYIKGNELYGFDIQLVIMKKSQLPFTINNYLVLNIKEWIGLFKELKKCKISYENKVINMNHDHISFKNKNYFYKSNYIIRTIEDKIRNRISVLYTDCKVSISNLREDKNFDPILDKNLKSDDGVIMYRKQGYCISLYKTLLGITAKDEISLSIYDIPNTMYFLSVFRLLPKKNPPIDIFIVYRKLP